MIKYDNNNRFDDLIFGIEQLNFFECLAAAPGTVYQLSTHKHKKIMSLLHIYLYIINTYKLI